MKWPESSRSSTSISSAWLRHRPTVLDEVRQGLEVVEADAGNTSAMEGAVPADLVLLCGIFGNVSDEAIGTTIRNVPRLCAPGATVIWTRHRRAPDVTPAMQAWFAEAGFEHVAYLPVPDSSGTVGVERLAASPQPFEPGLRLFEFIERLRLQGNNARRNLQRYSGPPVAVQVAVEVRSR